MIARWIARLGGTALIVLHFQQATYEVERLVVQKWAFAERIFSAAFLGMLLGALFGWRSDKGAAALLLSGYILAAAVPFFGRVDRPALATDPQGMAVALLPFAVVGLLYAYATKRKSTLD